MEWRMMKKPAAAAVKQERRADDSSVNGDEAAGGETPQNKAVGGNPVHSEENNTKTSTPLSQTDPTINKKDQGQLECTKAAMLEVREENERLKNILGQIVKDYQSLQLHFFDIMKQEEANNRLHDQPSYIQQSLTTNQQAEHELVSLSLGSGSNVSPAMKQKQKQGDEMTNTEESGDDRAKESLTLSLDCKNMEGKESEVSFKNEARLSLSSGNSSEETATKEETVTGDTWPPSKALKALKRSGEADGAAPQAQVKRARVSVRARCDAPTMNDGCQWRKYGQKIAKGNPCPRAYYRCTVAPGCPVRKQVQRCCDDMSILITTYEGNHSHPLPTAATAMASTTSAAACMLTSGSSTSLSAAAPSHSTADAGLNFSLPDSSHPNRQFYFTNPSISPSPSQPTITLDLTNPSVAGQQLNRFSSSSSSRSFYSPLPANFSFSPSDSSGWSSRSNGNYMGYAAHEPYYKSYNMGALRQSQESLFNSYAQKNPLTDTIAKAITSDPTFQSALAAAITSYVGGSAVVGVEGSSTGGGGVLKWGEQLQLASSLTAAAGATAGIANSSPGYMVGSASSSSSKQQGSLVFLPPTSKNNGPIGSPRNIS